MPASGSFYVRKFDVYGKVTCDQIQNLEFSVDEIVIHDGGKFQCDMSDSRRRVLKLTLSGNTKEITVNPGGTLDLHGFERTSWSQIHGSVLAGANSFSVAKNPGWEVGDEVVLAPTDFDPFEYDRVHITSVTQNSDGSVRYTVSPSFKFFHYGLQETYDGKVIDMRAEVGLLTRNLKIMGDLSSLTTERGGVISIHGERAAGHFSNIELRYMGQRSMTRSYPIHWHNVNDGKGQYARRVSIFHSFNRCITIHCTDRIRLEENVCVDHLGHGFFLEDGAEVENMIIGNLGIATRENTKDPLLASDQNPTTSFYGPSTFWWVHPKNTFINNVAAGSAFGGFSLEFSRESFEREAKMTTCNSRREGFLARSSYPLDTFSGNRVHSANASAFQVGNFVKPSKKSVMTDGQSYKIGCSHVWGSQGAIWFHGTNMVAQNFIVADACQHLWLVYRNSVEDSVLVGWTNNIGKKPRHQRFIAHAIYDGPSNLRNVSFVNFSNYPSPYDDIKGFHYDVFGGAETSTKNTIENIRYVNPDHPVFTYGCDNVFRAAQIEKIDGTGKTLEYYINPDCQKNIDPLRYDPSCKYDERMKEFVCKTTSSGAVLTINPNLPKNVEKPVLVTASNSALNYNASRKIRLGSTFGHIYEFSIIPSLEYDLKLENNLNWSNISVNLQFGRKNERYYLRLHNMPTAFSINQNAKMYSTVAGMKQSQETVPVYAFEGNVMHLIVTMTNDEFVFGSANGQIASSGIFTIS
jgi:hypothetical protein